MDENRDATDRMVAAAIASCHARCGRPLFVGLSGAQGSGKTTAGKRLSSLLTDEGLPTAILALDDFYLTRRQRESLGNRVHPLLVTRGVPGTHDRALIADAVEALLAGRPARIPHFDKASDDRAGWSTLTGPFTIVLLEGWCVGARAQPDSALTHPVNRLEREEDPGGTWRRWVNAQLASSYAALFGRLDLSVMLRAPGFAVVERWRTEQEAHLGARAMSADQMAWFVQHYERITRWMLEDEPADLIIDLDPARVPVRVRQR